MNIIRSLKRPVAAALFLVFAVGAALALYVPPNAFFTPRVLSTQQIVYFRVTVNFNDANIASGVQFGMIPQNSEIVDVQVDVVTAFNAVTTNVLTIGTTSNANELVSGADVDETTVGVTKVTRGYGRSLTSAGDTGLWAKYTQTGTAATAGQATFTIAYIQPNDL